MKFSEHIRDRGSDRQHQKRGNGVWIGLVLLMASASAWLSCQPRKQGDIETNIPEDQGSYIPQTASGSQGSPGGSIPNLPGSGGGLPSTGSGSLAGKIGPAEESSLLGNWTGTTDLVALGWKMVDLQPGVSPPNGTPSNGAGTKIGTSVSTDVTTNTPAVSGAGGLVSYTKQIKPLLDRYCVTCHKAGGSRSNSPLDVYPGLQLAKQSAAQIKGGLMPKPGSLQLSAENKALFQRWETSGFAQ